jgi:transposase
VTGLENGLAKRNGRLKSGGTHPVSKLVGRRKAKPPIGAFKPERQNENESVGLFEEGEVMLEVKVERCAGIDVGKKFLAVCVLIGRGNEKPVAEVRRFGTNVKELERLRAWLMESGCTEAVMESTGSYWKPVFNVLESHLKIILANPEQVKALRGKKTDPNDSRWLASLLRHGLVQGSFIPPRDIRELRDLTRRRRRLVGDGAAERNRVHKVLEDANVKLGNVLSDVFGTSGQAMLEALLENQRSAREIAELGHWSLTPKIPQIVEALEGHRMSDHHRFLIRQSLRHMRYIEEMIEELDKEIAVRLKPYQQQVALACTVPGIKPNAAASILAETGMDMSPDGPFPDCHHLASWAAICPGNDESAGKRRSGKTRQGNRWLKATLTQTAWAGAASKSSLFQARYHRLKLRRGGQRAVIAIAHAQLRAVYWALRNGTPYPEQIQRLQQDRREAQIRHHLQRLTTLGYEPNKLG